MQEDFCIFRASLRFGVCGQDLKKKIEAKTQVSKGQSHMRGPEHI